MERQIYLKRMNDYPVVVRRVDAKFIWSQTNFNKNPRRARKIYLRPGAKPECTFFNHFIHPGGQKASSTECYPVSTSLSRMNSPPCEIGRNPLYDFDGRERRKEPWSEGGPGAVSFHPQSDTRLPADDQKRYRWD